MLKFLTRKLRTQSLNEDARHKVEERDSGTESDDEPRGPGESYAELSDETDDTMKWDDITDISAPSSLPPPDLETLDGLDLMYDQHSSEEELEVINGAPGPCSAAGPPAPPADSRRRPAGSPPPADCCKRKWTPRDRYHDKVETPVRFRTSPPLEALKPRRARAATPSSRCSPPPPSPARSRSPSPARRRHPPHRTHPPAPRRHRPALDFDKMQQLKVGGGVRSWRQGGGAAGGGELSVFCW